MAAGATTVGRFRLGWWITESSAGDVVNVAVVIRRGRSDFAAVATYGIDPDRVRDGRDECLIVRSHVPPRIPGLTALMFLAGPETLARVIPGVGVDQGYRIADEIHNSGQSIVWSGPREPAELYWEQLSSAGLTMAPLEQC